MVATPRKKVCQYVIKMNFKKSNATKAFSYNVSNGLEDISEGNSTDPKLQLKQDILADAKAFIWQSTDFLTGGV